jgi:hypothetical protein
MLAAFWDIEPCIPEVDRRFEVPTASIMVMNGDGDSKHLRNVGLLQPNYTEHRCLQDSRTQSPVVQK